MVRSTIVEAIAVETEFIMVDTSGTRVCTGVKVTYPTRPKTFNSRSLVIRPTAMEVGRADQQKQKGRFG